VKKRRRRWVVVAAVTLTLSLLVGALVFREQPPHEFMRGMQRVRTELIHAPPAADAAFLTFVSELSAPEVSRKAEAELPGKGLHGSVSYFTTRDLEHGVNVFIFGHSEGQLHDENLSEKTGIMVRRPPTAMDRFNAWFDRLMRR
jgi:hypothetical protein